MPVPGIEIRERPARAGFTPTRADVALFVGLVHRRPGPLPGAISDWIAQTDFARPGPLFRTAEKREALLDIPVPIDSFETFDALFAWDERSLVAGSPEQVPCRLGLAVRSFFEEGGAKAYVVRTGDPLPVLAPHDADREAAWREFRNLLAWRKATAPVDAAERAPLLPGFIGAAGPGDMRDPANWSGAALVHYLEDVALLLLPDLPDLIAGPAQVQRTEFVPDTIEEQFVDCAPEAPAVVLLPRPAGKRVLAPRLTKGDFGTWRKAIGVALDILAGTGGASHRRDVMLLASLPLLDAASLDGSQDEAERTLALVHQSGAISSARLQLAWPWLATPAASLLGEGVEGGEGVLAGAIARTTLTDGAHSPATGRLRSTIRSTLPALSQRMLQTGHEPAQADWLGATLSLFGRKAGEWRLLSDATTSGSTHWQAGSVSRLMASLVRNARQLGELFFFEASSPETWGRICRQFEGLLRSMWRDGVLGGRSEAEAFTVVCDRRSMTQADLDSGRLVADIEVLPAQLVERIKVSLVLWAGDKA
jgi:hypothetical protein